MRGVLEDVETSSLSEQEKALFRFLERVNHDSPRIAAGELEELRAIGWTDEQLYYAITVCALFNFYNRWIDASGVHAMSPESHREGAVRSAQQGYVRK